MKKIILVILIGFSIVLNSLAQECNCLESFEWLINIIEKNDAGFQYIIDKKGKDDYNKFTHKQREKSKITTSLVACQTVLDDWTHYFRSGHIGVSLKESNANVKGYTDEEIRQKYKNEKTIDLTEKQLISLLEKKQNIDPIEGIWHYENNTYKIHTLYTIGIIKDEKSDKKFTAFIINADSIYWVPKQIKAEFSINDDKKSYSVDFCLRNHSIQNFQVKFVNDSTNMFYLIDNFWTRLYPENTLTIKEKMLLLFKNSMFPFFEKLSDKTIYLRIPSFEYYQKIYIDSILVKYDKIIKNTPNLIIDIRNGTGGSDHSWSNLIPYLYTNTIRNLNQQYYASELNATEYENYSKAFKDTAIGNRCKNVAKKMREHYGEFITLSNLKYATFTLDKIFPYPQKVAIICNHNNASADEMFLYIAKQSSKVKIFGKPTMGCLDISNMKALDFPNGKFTLFYGMTKNLRIPDYCIDGVGIQPDYFIDDTIKEEDWIEYIQAILE